MINVGNPFTAATLGQYGDILTNQIWFTGDNSGSGSAGSELVTANVNGATATSPNSTPPGFTTPPNPPFTDSNPWANTSIALDAADGLYFITNNPVAAGNAQIYEGHISGSGGLTQIYSAPDTNGVDFLGEMVYNAPNHKLYFVVSDNTAPDGLSPAQAGGTVDTGIFTLNIAADGTTSNLTRLVSWGGASGIQNPYGIAIDNTNNLLFITDFGDSHNVPQVFNPRLEVANLTTGAILNSSLQFLDASQNNPNYFYYIWGVEVDPASDKLYWTTADPNNNATSIAHNQIFSATYSTGATPTLSNITALYTAPTDGPNPTNLSIDVANGVYYVGLGSSAITTGTIVEGSLSTPNGTQTTIYTLPTNTQPQAILYEAAPVLSVTGASPTALPGGSAVDLTSSVTVTDTLQNIASATVTISSGLQTGDTLSFHSGASSWTFADGNTINATYTSGTGVLTLSGVASAADYQQALDSVSFATTATTGASRSFSWSTTDGHLASAAASSSATVHLAPIISTSGTVTFDGGGSPVVLDGTLTVSSPTTTTLASATISIDSGHFLTGDSLNFVNTSSATEGNIAVQSYDAVHGVLTLVSSGATATLAQWQAALRSITYSFTANGDPTGGGGDTTRTITWTVNDGTSSSAADTSALSDVHVAPTVNASGTVSFTGGGSPVTLDSTLALTVPDSSGNLAGATVTISSGFQTVDRLSINGQTSGTIAGTNITVSYDAVHGVLTLSGTDTAAHYDSVLDLVQYSVTANGDPTAGGSHTSRTISWTVTDGSTSNGTTTDTSALTTVHTAPAVTVSGTPQYAAGGPATVLDSGFIVTDLNSGGNLAGATVKISAGFLTGDTLAATTTGTNITVGYDAVHGVLTLSGTDTIAHYQTVLQSITYSSTATDPTGAGTDTSRTIQWTVTDGSTSNGTSNTGSLSLGVITGPLIVAGDTVSFRAGAAPVTFDGGLTVSDVPHDHAGRRHGVDHWRTPERRHARGGHHRHQHHGELQYGHRRPDPVGQRYRGPLPGRPGQRHLPEHDRPTRPAAAPTSAAPSPGRPATAAATRAAPPAPCNVRTPPVVVAGASVSFTAGGPAVVLDAGLTLSDPEDRNAQRAPR